MTSLIFLFCLSVADVTGIWMGEKPDLAFQLRATPAGLTGTLFGDELDLPLEGIAVEGDHVTFFVTNIDYRDRKTTKTVFEGIVGADGLLTLTRERPAPAKKETILLKRIVR